MSNARVGARAPWAQPFATELAGAIDGTTVARVVVRLRKPKGGVSEFEDNSPETTVGKVVATWALAVDGSSLDEPGTWRWVAYFYAAGGVLLGWSEVGSLPVDPEIVPFPS